MRTRWILAAVMALLAVTSGAASAQGRGRGRDKDKGMPPGQARKAERAEQGDRGDRGEARFADHDREIARNWYVHERRNPNQDRELPPGLRDRDRLPPGIERKLERGWVIDPDDRRLLYPPPPVLVRSFAPPPPGYQYFLIGGHMVLVDPGYRVFDVIHLELNLRM